MKIKDLKKIIENLHDDTDVIVNFSSTQCKQVHYVGEMMISPAGTKNTMSGWALLLEVDPRGEILNLDGNRLVFPVE